jgi:hypothetical protein
MLGKNRSVCYYLKENNNSKIYIFRNEKGIINCLSECLMEINE